MVEFSLRAVSVHDDWWTVTAGMASDGVSYDVEVDGERYAHRTSLTNLVGLYLCVREGNTAACRRCHYEAAVLGPDQVRLSLNYAGADGETVVLDRNDVCEALEPFLAEIVRRLDRVSTSNQRTDGLEYLESVFDCDARHLYERLLDEGAE